MGDDFEQLLKTMDLLGSKVGQLMKEGTDSATNYIENTWNQWSGRTADVDHQTVEIFNDYMGNQYRWTHVHRADNNFDNVDDSQDIYILEDQVGHHRQFDDTISAKQAIEKLNSGRIQEVFEENPLLEDEKASCLFYAPFGIYILLSILMLLLTIFLAVMCFRRRRLMLLQMEQTRQRRILRNNEELAWAQGHTQYHAEQNHDSNDDEELVKPGILDKPPSYEHVTKEETTAPPKYEDIA